ncbi:MAG: phenylalanine--tRNA ligase subunit beta [Spirochaetia bacterium]
MPKIEANQDTLFAYMGTRMKEAELELLLEAAKAEIDESADADGFMKIELNDTNRPDLWSTAGLGRQLRVYLGGELPDYPFFSSADRAADAGERRVVVDAGLKSIRPYIAAFAVSGKSIDDPSLRDLIQSQEKLCTNFGRHRKSIAMGVYRTRLITYPVRYVAADPDGTRFVPLGMDTELSLREIITEHPKGLEYGPIVADFPKMPFITDIQGEVLSFPPVINSARVGAVEVGDDELFIELTGTDIESLLLACNIVACDLADAGHTVHPVRVEYPFDTPLGREIVTPYYFQQPIDADLSAVGKLLGEQIDGVAAVKALRSMGVAATSTGGTLTARPPEYRNDFLHQVDLAEDIMMGRGMKTFTPEMPSDFTIGRLTEIELFGRLAISTMVGLGFQEMISPYLGSGRDLIHRMRPVPLSADTSGASSGLEDGVTAPIRLANPMSESYEYVRNSIVPYLLNSESVSAHAVYPHHIFELGKIARFEPDDVHGVKTVNSLGFLSADASAGFTLASSHVSILFYYLSREHELTESDDERFIPGRVATILVGGRPVGVFGEIHPQVLENIGIDVPCTACEIDLDLVLGSGYLAKGT